MWNYFKLRRNCGYGCDASDVVFVGSTKQNIVPIVPRHVVMLVLDRLRGGHQQMHISRSMMCGMVCPTAAEHVPAAAATVVVMMLWKCFVGAICGPLGRCRACPRSRHIPNGDRCNSASSRRSREIEAEGQTVACYGRARTPS